MREFTYSQKPFLRKNNFQLLKGGVSYFVSVRKGTSVGRRWWYHSELSVTRINVIFLYIWTLLLCFKCTVELRRASFLVKFCVAYLLTSGGGERRRSKCSIPNCMVVLGEGYFFFFLICLVKEDLEECLQISLMMLYDYFVKTGVRLLVITERSFHCSETCSPQDQIDPLSTAEIFVMLSNSSHPKLPLFCSPVLLRYCISWLLLNKLSSIVRKSSWCVLSNCCVHCNDFIFTL